MSDWTSTAVALLEADANRSADTHLHLVDAAEMLRIRNTILLGVSEEAERCVADQLVFGRAEAELLAIDAGYPLWTGGPLTYAERHAANGAHE